MRNIRISLFLFPWEIDTFQDTIDRLKLSANYIKDVTDYNIIVDITMNISDKAMDWDKSIVPKSFFIDSFENICSKLNYFLQTESTIDDTDTIMGCVDKRRESIEKSSEDDFILWLDSDVYFPTNILHSLISALQVIDDDYFILSPQLAKMWDSSWDVITNKKFINDDTEKRVTPGNEIVGYDLLNQQYYFNEEVALSKIQTFKFSGGWFNLFSAKLLKKIGIPKSFGSYGLEDTFVMKLCLTMKHMGYDVNQYVLENVIVGQTLLNTFGNNFEFNKLFEIKLPPKEEQKKIAQSNFSREIMEKIEELENE